MTGRSFSGTGTGPHLGQWIMGIGAPQYRCLETHQSCSLKLILNAPFRVSASQLVTALIPSGRFFFPENSAESTMTPSSSYAASIFAGSSDDPDSGPMTTLIGSLYFFANSKSRWSCAGTAMTP